ncbi:MAG: Fe-S cluster assembly protein SufD [Acidobacteria bacterium]|nr:Fe-S cluster assembly protein SufD [Acidobacteriota bacterium]
MASTTAVGETRLLQQFKKNIGANDRLRPLREAAFDYFRENGFPTPRLEEWKYTNIAALGQEDWTLREPGASPELDDDMLRLLNGFNLTRNGLAALNIGLAEIVPVRIPKDTSIAEPIDLSFDGGRDGKASFRHYLVIAEAGSKATVVERYSSTAKGWVNTSIQILVEDNANLTHYRVQKDSAEAFHTGITEVTLGRGGLYDSTNINLGAAISRHDIDVRFTAEGGEAAVDGLYMLNGTQHSDTHSVIDHMVPNCTSRQTYRGVLNDRSRGVFNGKVFVRENAHGTDAQQSNKNLLLSNDARVDTKPQLEIFNDDVKCSHGATVGQLEEEELFYLITRGLPPALARNLLTYGFAEEIINKIALDSMKAELDQAVLNRLQTVI